MYEFKENNICQFDNMIRVCSGWVSRVSIIIGLGHNNFKVKYIEIYLFLFEFIY